MEILYKNKTKRVIPIFLDYEEEQYEKILKGKDQKVNDLSSSKYCQPKLSKRALFSPTPQHQNLIFFNSQFSFEVKSKRRTWRRLAI